MTEPVSTNSAAYVRAIAGALLSSVPSMGMLPVDIPVATISTAGTSHRRKAFAEVAAATFMDMWPKVTARLGELGMLDDDHDGEGASAPVRETIDVAMAFIRALPFYAPTVAVGLTREGYALAEFHDEGEFGQVVFRPNRVVEAYHSRPGKPSVYFEGEIADPAISNTFRNTFGFQLEA